MFEILSDTYKFSWNVCGFSSDIFVGFLSEICEFLSDICRFSVGNFVYIFCNSSFSLDSKIYNKQMGNYWSGTPPSMLDEQIKTHCIVVYSTTVCAFCSRTKNLLNDMNLSYHVVELDQMAHHEGGKVAQELRNKTRMLSVGLYFDIFCKRFKAL